MVSLIQQILQHLLKRIFTLAMHPRWQGLHPQLEDSRRWIDTTPKKSITPGYAKRYELAAARQLSFPNPLATLRIVSEKEAALLLFYASILLHSHKERLLISQISVELALCYFAGFRYTLIASASCLQYIDCGC
ncbi:83de940d-450a-4594-b0b6-1577de387e46-CDS [Sclerotinia trifoliorum]|uniref:83de940d-450a-4594-b0b6-1577de387e46-CDS n=1 Tax=Sclerotinia trifoliorum TaxID=28548 RepID=A0A8H2VMJ0_9HELO|nr:83de940d-450a-4594-b0b6-1577de387e46-CDS [Sclerotinia trifoliorum]